MSVASTDTNVRQVAPHPQGLPQGLSLWEFGASVTGDATGGGATLVIEVRPEAGTTNLYVAALRVTAVCSDTTGQQVRFSSKLADYDSITPGGLDPVRAAAATVGSDRIMAELVDPSKPIYLGRVTDNKEGDITVNFPTNVNTKVYNIYGYLLTSTAPFVVPSWIRV